jgi:uncharacterized membrane protein (UPF0136 family)
VNTPPRSTRSRLLWGYLQGLAFIVAGAAMTEWTGSLIPLALGASAAVLRTLSVVRALASRKAD